ncbi:hypothetical protein SCLCIDRAFT_108251, partial [Scleroderma citrinum Foug A]
LSFGSAPDIQSQMDAIPRGPSWCSLMIHVEGYPTRELIQLYWHDTLEVV